MTTLTMKFGGTSVGSPEAFAQAANIVLEQAQKWDHLVVVVSAMSGVTDALIRGALTAASGDGQTYHAIATDLRACHYRAVDTLLEPDGERSSLLAVVDEYLDGFAAFCHSVHILGEVTPRAMDAISSLGERISARILAAVLRQQGAHSEAVDATELIVTDDTFQNAAPLLEATRARVSARLAPLLDEGIIPVVTGFIGATEDGVTTTLGRGGSDYTAAILGDCLDADEVWTWTDVDERGIPLWVKNTFNPTCPGTRIVHEPESAPSTVKAVTAIKGLSMVTVEGRGMMGVPGIAARTFSAVAGRGASVLMIVQASSEQSICFIIPTEAVSPVIRAIEEEMALELGRGDIDRVWSLDDVVIVTAVGAGMRGTPGIAARIFGALGRGNINIIAIAQGSSECSISLVVMADDAADAVRQIHSEVILNAGPET